MKEEKSSRREIFRKELVELAGSVLGDESRAEDELRYVGRAKGFLIVPDELIFAGEALSGGAKIVWSVLLQHCRNGQRVCWPGRGRLAIMCGMSLRSVTTHLSELRVKSLLKSRRRPNASSLYLVYDPPKAWMRATKKKLSQLKQLRRERQKDRRREGIEAFSR